MMRNIIVRINENFKNKKSSRKENKNIPDFTKKEKEIFENFLKNIKKTIKYRNKESWWEKNNGFGKITTPAGNFFEYNNIWHIHVDEFFCFDKTGKTIEYEIYKGITSNYIIFYKKEIQDNNLIVEILLMSVHPKGSQWGIAKNNIQNNIQDY